MYGVTWKTKLKIKNDLDCLPTSLIYNHDLEKDLDRTFPEIDFFKIHKDVLKNIILNFIEVNSAMDYFQGICYIVYTLFYAFKDTKNPEYNTFYSLHKIIGPIRPIIPLDDKDIKPLTFIKNFEKLVLLCVFKKNHELGIRLKDIDIIHIFIVQGLPSLFSNWYTLDETLMLWDYLIDESAQVMLDNILNYLLCFFIYHEKIILYLDVDKILQLMQQRHGLGQILLMLKNFSV